MLFIFGDIGENNHFTEKILVFVEIGFYILIKTIIFASNNRIK